MDARVRDLLGRLAREPAFADRFFADPDPILSDLDLDPADREALRALDRDAVNYLAVAHELEPANAPEHPANHAGNRYLTYVIALWGCIAYVALWLLYRGGL